MLHVTSLVCFFFCFLTEFPRTMWGFPRWRQRRQNMNATERSIFELENVWKTLKKYPVCTANSTKKLPDILDILEFRCWRVGTLKKKKIKNRHYIMYPTGTMQKPQPISRKKTCVLSFFSPPFTVLRTTSNSDDPLDSHDALQRTKLFAANWNDDNRTMNAQNWPADWHG